jgi:hypothetical protein
MSVQLFQLLYFYSRNLVLTMALSTIVTIVGVYVYRRLKKDTECDQQQQDRPNQRVPREDEIQPRESTTVAENQWQVILQFI